MDLWAQTTDNRRGARPTANMSRTAMLKLFSSELICAQPQLHFEHPLDASVPFVVYLLIA